MIIKKFIGKTEDEATQAARSELGQSIVIMNVRPVRRAGFWSFLRSPRTEVTVALEDEPEEEIKKNIPKAKFSVQTPEEISDKKDVGSRLAQASRNGTLPPLKVDVPVKEGEPIMVERPGTTVSPETSAAIEEKLDSLHSLLEKNIVSNKIEKKQEEHPESEDKNKVHVKEDPIPEELVGFIRLLYNTMIENEVDERYANELTDDVENFAKPGLPLEYALSNVYQKMILRFGKSEEIEPSENGVKAEIFIGPTGVGKTTTIAKLASQLSVANHKKVALVTIDTYRIAAAEQLRTYASILEIPFRVIYSIEEMEEALKDFSDMDYIMVDTAGHSIHNNEQRSDAEVFIRTIQNSYDSDVFLVMSATTKYRDLIEIADTYKQDFDYKLIFTKMDETSAAGNLYNIKIHTGAPMSYITNGQNVPDDIAVFDAQKIVKNLLGGKKQE